MREMPHLRAWATAMVSGIATALLDSLPEFEAHHVRIKGFATMCLSQTRL